MPEEGDEIEFFLSNWHYGLNTTLTAADVAEAEAVLNSLGGECMEIDPASLSLDYDFSQTNIESPVTAIYGGATGTTTAYVADITGALSVQVGASTVARKDSRMDHLEICLLYTSRAFRPETAKRGPPLLLASQTQVKTTVRMSKREKSQIR